MTVAQISMKPAAARAAYEAYRSAVRSSRTATKQAWQRADVALMRGYKALAAGKRVLDLHAVMTTAGLREDFYPKLAICPAHATECELRLHQNGGAVMGISRWRTGRRSVVQLPSGTFPTFTTYPPGSRTRPHGWDSDVVTTVPLVPPQFRPNHDLSGYHLLWEVDEWKRVPPRDPMLLKHLGGALYVVLATWDLTPLEMAALR
jgi:hypothetical protein